MGGEFAYLGISEGGKTSARLATLPADGPAGGSTARALLKDRNKVRGGVRNTARRLCGELPEVTWL
jgi:hypothetical protein